MGDQYEDDPIEDQTVNILEDAQGYIAYPPGMMTDMKNLAAEIKKMRKKLQDIAERCELCYANDGAGYYLADGIMEIINRVDG